MRFTHYFAIAGFLVPTASLILAVVISLTATTEMPAEIGVNPTSLAVFYADMEKQP